MLVVLCKYANFIDYSNKKESVNVILIITIIVLIVLVVKMILVLSIRRTASVAQLVEQWVVMREVVSSTPDGPTLRALKITE